MCKEKVWDSMTLAGLRVGQAKNAFYLGSTFCVCPLIGREPVSLGLAPEIRQVKGVWMDTWWGCTRLARFGLIDPNWEDLCPFCTPMDLGRLRYGSPGDCGSCGV
jgi:hypothetical protein